VSSDVYFGGQSTNEGVEKLSSEFGVNKTAARFYIAIYAGLMKGKVLKRTMSASAMRHFLNQIFDVHGSPALSIALTSLRSHIKYYEGHYKTTMHAMRAVLLELEPQAVDPTNTDQIERSFELAVSKSLQDSRTARQDRLAHTNATPRAILVQTKVFIRNPDVVAEVLLRASGICEHCNRKAPFLRAKDRSPYLEVHHKRQLANGGKDTVENAIALCPNCHREAHYG